ncbi:MAG: NAD+ synthase [Verrucomicrobia bacterium]|nr:NAD+ synthase [Verrucomicrobiota bacterium]
MRIALAQLNTTVGDIAGNEGLVLEAYRRGVETQVELVLTPELSLTGYPPRDLLLRESFIRANQAALERLAAAVGEVGLIVGFVGENPVRPGRPLTNAAALLHRGRVMAIRTKTLLPTYDVFDEDRYFEPASENAVIHWEGRKLGLTICEDIWNDAEFGVQRRYRPDPAAALVASGAEILINLSASPWQLGKEQRRCALLRSLARRHQVPVVYCNLVGGNDELVFDGRSLAFNSAGGCLGEAAHFSSDFLIVDTEAADDRPLVPVADEALLHDALVLGMRDYVGKCGFHSVVLGLSGGIDSALVAALAVDALGTKNVRGLALPTEFSSTGSIDDARSLAANLGIQFDVVPIQGTFEALKRQMEPLFEGRSEDTTEENLQARLRGVTLMAMSNKFGSLLLTTGNKSELAVGYCTLYGDMCGGLAVISDLPKTWVYRVSRWINRGREIIPSSSITKAPSAELRPNQTDQDSLPPYEVLDAILEAYVVEDRPAAEIIASGFSEADVRRVVRLIDLSEYKRRQAAPGLKVTSRAFGVGRRQPVAQRWREI